jgi:chemotaxis signal transduction protein
VSDAFVILQLPHRLFALLVSEVEGVIGIDSADLVPGGTLIDGLAQVQGLVKTSEGLLLIDDPQQFLDIHEMRARASALDARHAG